MNKNNHQKSFTPLESQLEPLCCNKQKAKPPIGSVRSKGRFLFRILTGFTVIELLVTIAVIGLVASIVLVALDLPGRKRQASQAKALEFSQSMQNAIGDELVGSWTFENVAGGKTPDMSGNNNTGAIYGGATQVDGLRLASGVGTGKALSFDGVDDYVSVNDSASLSPTNAVTVSGWIKTSSVQGGRGVIVKGGPLADYDYMLYFTGTTAGSVNFYMKDSTGIADSNGTSFAYNDNTWHYYTGIFDGDWLRLYIDGKLVSSKDTALTNVRDSANPFTIGRGWSTYFIGLIDEVRIYGKALTLGEIQKQYAEGLKKHENLVVK